MMCLLVNLSRKEGHPAASFFRCQGRSGLQIALKWGQPGPVPHHRPMQMLQQVLADRVTSELILGKNSEAAVDTLTLLRLTFIQRNEPTLLAFLVRVGSIGYALRAVTDGIERHAAEDANRVARDANGQAEINARLQSVDQSYQSSNKMHINGAILLFIHYS